MIAGVDEAGRGCLAGPVVAAAVVLPEDAELPGVTDSKLLSASRRRELLRLVEEQAVAIGIGEAGPGEIDEINILQATLRAMVRAVEALSPEPDLLLIDGRQKIPHALPQRCLVKGDRICLSISAASIVAKVHRDDLMEAYHRRYPVYNFAAHKGYGTAEHRRAIARFGACPIHRRSFRGVREWVSGEEEQAPSAAGGRRSQPTIF